MRRIKVAHTIEQAGVSLEQMGGAMRTGVVSLAFLDEGAYDVLPSFSEVSYADLSASTGVPVDVLLMIRESTGSARTAATDRVTEDELNVVRFIDAMWGSGVAPRGIERMLRIHGEGLRRIAESEADWWYTELMPALGLSGPTETLEGVNRLPPDALALSNEAFLSIYRTQQARVWTKNIIERVEEALEGAGLYDRLERLPAISFVDLTGYTRLAEEQGDVAAADLAERLARMVDRISLEHGGQLVKRLGDGVMLYFADPGRGVLASLEMVEQAAALGFPPAHVGVHSGPVLFQDGDYYGRTVNVASRIADQARPGEVLVSQQVVDSSQAPDVVYTEIGPVELRGVSKPTRLSTAQRLRPS